MKKVCFAVVLLAVLCFAHFADAALIDNGNGLIYDTDLDITWYDASRVVRTWEEAVEWAASLSVTDSYGNVITGWRLPTALDEKYVWGYNGSTTGGYNVTSSELGYLFYVELQNAGYYDTDGNFPVEGYGLTNVGPFKNLQGISYSYWSGTEYTYDTTRAWYFGMNRGQQAIALKDHGHYALAVHEGNVGGNVGASAPIPTSLFLLIPGLIGMGVIRRRTGK